MNKLTVEPKGGISTLVRAKFGPGMLLHHDDLEQLNSYTRDLSRLMFRSFFGCGVVCGLVVTADETCGNQLTITVSAGMALDGNGDPVYVPKNQSFSIDGVTEVKQMWVVLCGTTKSCAPRTAMCASDDDEPTSPCTRERDGYEIRVVSKRPECACGFEKPEYNVPLKETDCKCKCVNPDLPCYKDHYDGKCGCNCNECSDGDCKGIVLARLDKTKNNEHPWYAEHRVRRFIRPVLMRDPFLDNERADATSGPPSKDKSASEKAYATETIADTTSNPKGATDENRMLEKLLSDVSKSDSETKSPPLKRDSKKLNSATSKNHAKAAKKK